MFSSVIRALISPPLIAEIIACVFSWPQATPILMGILLSDARESAIVLSENEVLISFPSLS